MPPANDMKPGPSGSAAPAPPSMPAPPWPELKLSKDLTLATLIFPPQYRHTIEETQQWLKDQGVVFGVDAEGLAKTVALAAKSQKPFSVEIARGKPPVEAQDGKIEYCVERLDAAKEAVSDKKIDFHETGKIITVQAGQVLAKLHAPIDGAAGMTVTGKEIAPRKLHGIMPHLALGRNVQQKDNQVLATAAGLVEIKGASLQVLTDLTINEDIDFKTGNIHFPGQSVTIRGSVTPGFVVECAGKVLITGDVEDAQIKAGGDIVIQQGCVGEHKTIVIGGGNIQVGFIENSRVEAQGNISVRSHIIHSEVYADGSLHVSGGKGVIVGGSVQAVKGIEARVLGSEAIVKTLVAITESRQVAARLQEMEEALKTDEQNLQKIRLAVGEGKLASMLAHPEQIDAAHFGPQHALYQKLFQEYMALHEHIKQTQAARAALLKEGAAQEKGIIRVTGQVFQGVVIQIAGLNLEIKTDMGAATFRADMQKGEVIFA